MKRCAVDALCLAINDKHTSAVPVKVLVTIFKEIVIPAAQSLGHDLVQSVIDGTYSSSLAIPDDTTPDYKMKPEIYNNSNLPDSVKPKNVRAGVTGDFLSSLCKVSAKKIFILNAVGLLSSC